VRRLEVNLFAVSSGRRNSAESLLTAEAGNLELINVLSFCCGFRGLDIHVERDHQSVCVAVVLCILITKPSVNSRSDNKNYWP